MQTLLSPAPIEPVFLSTREATYLSLRGGLERAWQEALGTPSGSSQEPRPGVSDWR